MAQLQTENELFKSGGEATLKDSSCINNIHHSKDDIIEEANALRGTVDDPFESEGGQDAATLDIERVAAESANEQEMTSKTSVESTLIETPGSHPRSNGHGENEASTDVEDVDVESSSKRDDTQEIDDKGPPQAPEETLFTLTVKDSERQELEDGFGDAAEMREEIDEEGAKETLLKESKSGGVGKNKFQHDNNLFNNNGSTAKRPYSPADEEKTGAKADKLNGSDSTTSGGRSSRSNNSAAAASPAKRARGASGGGSRSSRARRVSVEDAEDDTDAEDRVLPAVKGRSPRAGSRAGAGTRGTRGSAVANGDAIENGMDCD